MSRSARVVVPALLLALVGLVGLVCAPALAAPAADAAAPEPAAGSAAPARAAAPNATSTAAAYYQLIRAEPVQDEMKLSDEQKQKVRAMVEALEKESQAEFAGLRNLPPEQQQIRFGQIQEAMGKRLLKLRGELEALITPEQLKQLQIIVFQMTLTPKMGDSRILQQLALSQEQQQKLARIRADMDAKMWQIQREMAQKALGLLTREQLKTLQEMPVPAPQGQQ